MKTPAMKDIAGVENQASNILNRGLFLRDSKQSELSAQTDADTIPVVVAACDIRAGSRVVV